MFLQRDALRRVEWIVVIIVMGAVPASLSADSAILSLSPQATAVLTNDVIEIELRVATPTGKDSDLSAVDALLVWDSATLELLQSDHSMCLEGNSLFCGFLPNPDDLNDGSGSPNLPNNDGDAFYSALAPLAPPLAIPSAPGLRVITFRFLALAETPETTVQIVDMLPGGSSETAVFAPGNERLMLDISSAVTSVAICGSTPDSDGDGVADACDICPGAPDNVDIDEDGLPDGCDPCPNTPTPGVMQGDVNDDNQVNLLDTPLFVDVLLGVDTDPMRVNASDMNCDGQVDGLDIEPFVAQLLL